jgi:hypothetical protein
MVIEVQLRIAFVLNGLNVAAKTKLFFENAA